MEVAQLKHGDFDKSSNLIKHGYLTRSRSVGPGVFGKARTARYIPVRQLTDTRTEIDRQRSIEEEKGKKKKRKIRRRRRGGEVPRAARWSPASRCRSRCPSDRSMEGVKGKKKKRKRRKNKKRRRTYFPRDVLARERFFLSRETECLPVWGERSRRQENKAIASYGSSPKQGSPYRSIPTYPAQLGTV
ncbi:hypothetical protein GW17_00026718, partial [Ensete ventricosum]